MAKTTDDLKQSMDRLTDIVNEAVSSGDFSHMSSDLGDLAKQVTDIGKEMFRTPSYSQTVRKTEKQTCRQQVSGMDFRSVTKNSTYSTSYGSRQETRDLTPYFMPKADTMGRKIGGIIGIAGSILWGFFAVIFALFFLIAVIAGIDGGGIMFAMTAVFGGITAAHVVLAVKMRTSARLMEHYNKYRKLLGSKLYANVKDISRDTFIPQDQVVKELETLTEKGMIRQGHFDTQKTCFMASDEIYEEYLKNELQRRAQLEEQNRKAAEEQEAAGNRAQMSPEVQKILTDGERYIQTIREANDRIPGEEVTGKLDRMEQIVRRIFSEVERRPNLAVRLDMFMSYYLPTTSKLVNAYADMDQDQLEGEHVSKSKHEIEESLDTINDAFETLLDSFFEEQALDVSSDISVMKTMLKQDGLTDDKPFES